MAYAIGSELTLGLHDLLLSDCSREQHSESRSGGSGGDTEQSESFEFFLISRFSFVASFVCMYAFIPSLRRELGRLLSGRVAAKYAIVSIAIVSMAIVSIAIVSMASVSRASVLTTCRSARARSARPLALMCGRREVQ